MGRDEKEWEYLSRKVTEAGADAIELNFSCPNMVEDGTGSDVGQSPRVVELFTKAARKGTNLPILSKLTPNVGIMSPAAEASIRGGADGIAAINTIKSLIEIEPGSGKVAVGGFSGNSVPNRNEIHLVTFTEQSTGKETHLCNGRHRNLERCPCLYSFGS